MLEIEALETGYGDTQVLHGIGLQAKKGRMLAVLGRNEPARPQR